MVSCSDCRHYINGRLYPRCARTKKKNVYASAFDDGKAREYYVFADTIDEVRQDENRCGRSAKWFEHKTPLKDFGVVMLGLLVFVGFVTVAGLSVWAIFKLVAYAVVTGSN